MILVRRNNRNLVTHNVHWHKQSGLNTNMDFGCKRQIIFFIILSLNLKCENYLFLFLSSLWKHPGKHGNEKILRSVRAFDSLMIRMVVYWAHVSYRFPGITFSQQVQITLHISSDSKVLQLPYAFNKLSFRPGLEESIAFHRAIHLNMFNTWK